MNIALLLLVMVAATLMGAFGAFFLKLGAERFSFNPLRLLRNGRFLIGATLYALSLPVYLFVLKHLPLSVAYPMTSMTYIWSALLSKRYLNERVDSWRWAGILLIVAGIALLST